MPLSPTATSLPAAEVTLYRLVLAAFEVWEAHVLPLEEISIVPLSPTAMNCDPVQVIPTRRLAVPEAWVAHVLPLLEVTIVPLFPTATYWLSDEAIPFS